MLAAQLALGSLPELGQPGPWASSRCAEIVSLPWGGPRVAVERLEPPRHADAMVLSRSLRCKNTVLVAAATLCPGRAGKTHGALSTVTPWGVRQGRTFAEGAAAAADVSPVP